MHFDYFTIPAIGTRGWGGILVAWRTDTWAASHVLRAQYSLTLKLTPMTLSDVWWPTSIYGPQTDQEKLCFLQEIRGICAGHLGMWLLCGDFNLIYKAVDKNNSWINSRLIVAFCRFLDDLELYELHLQGRLYTWSNEQVHPTLSHIDQACTCLQWLDHFP
jgi:hypothetical protein